MLDLAMVTTGFSVASSQFARIKFTSGVEITKKWKMSISSLILVLSEKFKGLVKALDQPDMAPSVNKQKSRLFGRYSSGVFVLHCPFLATIY